MAMSRLMIFQAVFLVLLIGFAAWLFAVIGAFGANITCILEQIAVLRTVGGGVGQQLAPLLAALPESTTSQIAQLVSLITLLAIIPVILILVMQLISFFCNYKGKTGGGIKCVVCLLILFCLLGIAFYIIIGGIGIATAQVATTALAGVDQTCKGEIPSIEKTLAESQAAVDQLKAAGVTSDALAAVEAEFAEIDKAVNALKAACVCIYGLFDSLLAFVAPGFLCAAMCVVLMILNCIGCCRLGCCGKPKSAKVSGY
jgi:hypothetical protein